MGQFFTDTVSGISGAIQNWNTQLENIDGNFVEQLNKRHFIVLLFILFVVSGTDALTGRFITCTGFEDSIFTSQSFVEDYCWTQGLFTNRFAYDLPRDSMPAPGIVPCIRIEDNFICSEEEQVEQKVFHLWYQWVSFFFVLTLGAFYTPHLVVKHTTRLGSLRSYIKHNATTVASLDPGCHKFLSIWLKINLTRRFGERWWRAYQVPVAILLTRTLFLLIAVLQFVLTAQMFPIGNYYKLGLQWHYPSTDNYTHVGDVLFPKMVGCLVKIYGNSGLQSVSGMCSLAPNVVLQYLFLTLWWSVVLLIFLNVLNVLWTAIEFRSISASRVDLSTQEMALKRLGDTYEPCIGDENYLQGATQEDVELVFRYYDLSSRLILGRVVSIVDPVYVTYTFKELAAYIREKRGRDKFLDNFLKSLESKGKERKEPQTS